MVSNLNFPLFIFTLTVFGILSIVVLLGSGFIIIVIGHRWLQNKKIVPCDFLLFSLNTSRFFLQLTVVVTYVLYFISPEASLHSYRDEDIIFILIFFNIVSFSSVTCLNFFYCVKVTNFNNFLFLWLKPRINILIPRFLGGLIIASLIYTLPSGFSYFQHKMCNVTENLPRKASQNEACGNLMLAFLPQQLFFTITHFAINITTSVLLLTSLWRHTRNLKKSGICAKDLNHQVHVGVMKLLLLSLLFYLIHFIGIIMNAGNSCNMGGIKRMVSDILQSTFPSVHSIVLILTSPKLKEEVARVLKARR
ncbi:taste receptor type 2 member 104-like [Sceloporus undulatus]|uniref:taste receptor type 2 member 104-like n=1 Tax=Sceloporus undulatus TaxID=8520 RepID=UPI001C4CACA4|nr:taste receptor type 2 member 104-like [Sceloporus undulatus]